ncbi:MAG TPA: segregation/condensation protein A [Candidatus Krumholzibacteria bacterium]|nr:segregation/condensation protein A [Candidatus Krumholzibacteria bacterium]
MADIRPASFTTELEGIRAPLGVILYLIRRDNLDIYDIPIAKITREYLDYLNAMEGMQIELAGDFFVLAATLMRIKVQMLLRKEDDSDEDPRQELVRSLLEYRKMVEAARGLKEIEEHRRNIFTRPIRPEDKTVTVEPEIDLSLYQLMRAFQEVMTQFEGAPVREVELESFTIEEKIDTVRAALEAREPMLFTDLFADSRSRLELIVTLMAVLELLKHGHARVEQETSFGPIWIYRGRNFGADLGAVDWEAEATAPVEVSLAAAPDAAEETDLSMHAPVDGPAEHESPAPGGMEDGHGESEPR